MSYCHQERCKIMWCIILLWLFFIFIPTPPAMAVKAFPTAEGFGAADTVGGRGGAVMFVTNLNNSGAGSFRACAEATGARTCVFRIGGMINITSPINILEANSFLTIAGQTAPGDGVTIGPWPINIKDGANHVIIRHLRHRQAFGEWSGNPSVPPNQNNDCGGFVLYGPDPTHTHHIILDHVSVGYTCDDSLQMSGYVTDSTIQWTMVSDPYECKLVCDGNGQNCFCQLDPYGATKGFIFGGNNPATAPLSTGTVHHSAFLNTGTRNPGGGPQGVMDWRYNLVYHWFACTGGLRLGGTDENVPGPLQSNHNFVGNLYVAGPETNTSGCWLGELRTEGNAHVYVQDNVTPFCGSCPVNTFDLGWGAEPSGAFPAPESIFRANTPFSAPSVTATARNAMESTISAKAGATIPKRDALDARVVSELASRTGNIGRLGAPFPTLPTITSFPADSDNDGMPDAWENSHGLNPNNSADRNTIASNGYTNLENYLNELAGDDIGGGVIEPPPPGANANPIYLSVGGHSDTPSDSGDCTVPENITTPRATLSAALACMQVPGKILYIRGGTYAGIIDTTAGLILGGANPGTPTRIEGYLAEVAIIQMPVGGVNALEINGISNFTINKLTIDAMNRAESNALACLNSSNIIVTNSTLKNTFYEVAYISNCNNLSITKSTLRDSTNAAIITLVGSNTTVKLEELQLLGGTLQAIDAPASATNDSLTISKNQIRSTGSGGASAAIDLGGGSGALVVNNIIDHNNAGIRIRSTNNGAKIYHNAIAANTNVGIQCDAGALNVKMNNNIIFSNGVDPISNACSAVLSSNQTTNPLWVDSSLGVRDFHLQNASVAIDVVSPPTLPEATTDIDGTLRPVGTLIDLGPYERTVIVPPVTVDPTLVMQFISRYLGMFF